VWGLLTGPLGMVLRLTRFVRIRGYGHGATLGAVHQASHWRRERLTRPSDGYQRRLPALAQVGGQPPGQGRGILREAFMVCSPEVSWCH
jgi:hypothetical protein